MGFRRESPLKVIFKSQYAIDLKKNSEAVITVSQF